MGVTAVHTIASLARAEGGPVYSVTRLCDSLARAGAGVHLVSLASTDVIGETILPRSKQVKVCLAKPAVLAGRRSAYSADFHRAIRESCRERPLVIHDHGAWLPTNISSWWVAKRLGIPLIVSPRGTCEPWALGQSPVKKRLALALYQRRILRDAALLCVTSEQEGENLRSLGLQRPLAVIPNGIDVPASVDRSARVDAPRTMLFLSRIHPKKGLPTLVEAWRRARPPGWRMIVAGPDEGGHRAEVERLVAAACLEASFEFVGPVYGDAKTELYRRASVFVLPTHSENFGLVVLEALAHGVPVITTRAAPWSDLERYRCGWWIDEGVPALEEALAQAGSAGADHLRAMGQRGREMAERKYRWDQIGERTLEAYRWALGHRAAPDFVHA
jgi:glycosyltransferase involved in cell wall biosynthesis